MKEYRSIKAVEAGKVVGVHHWQSKGVLTFTTEDGEQIIVPEDITAREGSGQPIGMYLVRDEDGYLSLSPADVFETGYIMKDKVFSSVPGLEHMTNQEIHDMVGQD